MIGAAEAAREAERGVLTVWPDGPVAAAGAAGRTGEPLLVARLDGTGHYWLVPWYDQGAITAVVQVDAASGRMLSAGRLPVPVQRIVPAPAEAAEAVARQCGQPPSGELRLVWRPCRESSSPLAPLYEVPTASGEVFVAVDGSVHRSLTPFGRGG